MLSLGTAEMWGRITVEGTGLPGFTGWTPAAPAPLLPPPCRDAENVPRPCQMFQGGEQGKHARFVKSCSRAWGHSPGSQWPRAPLRQKA